jgi:hypothetical protein
MCRCGGQSEADNVYKRVAGVSIDAQEGKRSREKTAWTSTEGAGGLVRIAAVSTVHVESCIYKL